MNRKNGSTERNVEKSLRCVECDSSSFHYEYKLREYSCLRCGLVCVSPYSPDFVTDGFKVVEKKESKQRKKR
jgi:transcription initiation factor TFIIIB Brf1 subunit/transcription initiation factor TFIIB